MKTFKKNLFWYFLSVLVVFLLVLHFFFPFRLLELVLVALASILMIMKSAGYMISSISDYSHQTGLSNYLLGFVIISACTTLPEFSTAIFASLAQKGSLILGDVIGANIINTTLVLGLVAILGRRMKIHGKKITSIIYLPLALLVFGFNGEISRLEGVFLLVFFAAYLIVLIFQETEKSKIVHDLRFSKIWKDILVFGFSIAALLIAARWMVLSTLEIAAIFQIPPFLMGLVFIALGTTIPELTIGLKSVLTGVKDVSFGNIFGAFATNICLVIGIAALINPITFDRINFLTSFSFMIAAIGLSLFFMRGKEINWKSGVWLLGVYLIFLITQVVLYFIS